MLVTFIVCAVSGCDKNSQWTWSCQINVTWYQIIPCKILNHCTVILLFYMFPMKKLPFWKIFWQVWCLDFLPECSIHLRIRDSVFFKEFNSNSSLTSPALCLKTLWYDHCKHKGNCCGLPMSMNCGTSSYVRNLQEKKQQAFEALPIFTPTCTWLAAAESKHDCQIVSFTKLHNWVMKAIFSKQNKRFSPPPGSWKSTLCLTFILALQGLDWNLYLDS